MNERWVCKRCFADNDETNAACQRCGLIRGAEATADDRAGWAGQPAAAAAKRDGWRRYLRFWWVPALAVVLLVGYFTNAHRGGDGAITDGGTLQVEDLRPGDCFDFEETDEISEVDALPCTDTHHYEMFHVVSWTGSDDYPSDAAIVDFIVDTCVPVFEDYVGLSYESSVFDFIPFTPTEEGWDGGDRVIQCALVDPGDAGLTTSLRDANR